MKYILGLTGQTGAGKSSLSKAAIEEGYFVIDCDKVAHSVTAGNKDAIAALVSAFSGDILNQDGSINRKKLAEFAFKNNESTLLLNKTVLPFIVIEINKLIENSKSEYILLDAPTLYESGADEICDYTVAVLSDEEIRRDRIIKRDNLSLNEANLRLSAAKSDEYYKGKADKIIYNNNNMDEFINEFRNILRRNEK